MNQSLDFCAIGVSKKARSHINFNQICNDHRFVQRPVAIKKIAHPIMYN